MATMARPDIAIDSIDLAQIGRLSVSLAPPLVLQNCPGSTRYIVEVTSGRLEGDRVRASLRPGTSADWLTISPDGSIGTLDVRATLETDDGALIFMRYNGRVDLVPGTGKAPIYTAPLFETGDPRYAWLNKIQAVAKGLPSEDLSHLDYEIFEVR